MSSVMKRQFDHLDRRWEVIWSGFGPVGRTLFLAPGQSGLRGAMGSGYQPPERVK